VATTKDRQRALARAKVERQNARRAAEARRKRQIQAGTAAGIAVVVLVLGALWFAGVFEPDKAKNAAKDCSWTAAPGGDAKDVGRPPTTKIAKTGTQTMSITTNQGAVDVVIDVKKVPCTAASISFLAGKHYFDNTKCHRLTNAGIFVLQCGDPKGTGKGGPGYRFEDENLPAATPASADPESPAPAGAKVVYPAGTVAMANSGVDTNGSQFFIVYKDSPLSPKYTRIGQVTHGLDVVQKVAAGGIAEGGQSANDGPPKIETVIQSLTVSPVKAVTPSAPAGAPSASPGSGPAGSATPSGSASKPQS
jgi:peptidyl-prolyl cis-trans isomerase B (cyclophilin B)